MDAVAISLALLEEVHGEADLKRLARRYVESCAATLATLAIWLATPLGMYTYILMPGAHATGFFLFALFLTLWLRRPRAGEAAYTRPFSALQSSDPAERSPRRWYAGAIGAVNFDGSINTGLTIRTIRMKDGLAEAHFAATPLSAALRP